MAELNFRFFENVNLFLFCSDRVRLMHDCIGLCVYSQSTNCEPLMAAASHWMLYKITLL